MPMGYPRRMAGTALGFLLLTIVAQAQQSTVQQYVISTFAGGVPQPTPVPGLSVYLGSLGTGAIAADSGGNVYFANAATVFRLDQSGTLTRIAGNARLGYSGDGGPATSAQLFYVNGLAVDGAGNVFISDGSRIRRISPSGIITTVAGTGTAGYSGDGGPATEAQLNLLSNGGLAVDGAGNLFFAASNRVRMVAPSGIITTVAGNGMCCSSGDGGPATSAQLGAGGIAVDSGGNLFIADANRVRKVSPNGIITTVAGNGTFGFSGDGGPATSAEVAPNGLAVDGSGDLFIADANVSIRKVSPAGIITTVAQVYGHDSSGQMCGTSGLAADSAGNLFVSDFSCARISKVGVDGMTTVVAGSANRTSSFSGDGGPAINAQLSQPSDVAVDGGGNVYIADFGNGRIRKVLPSGIITTAVGPGLNYPLGVAVDTSDNLFITDINRILKVSPDGTIATAAGTGTFGGSGDGPATSAQLDGANRVAVDSAGNLFIMGDNIISKVSPNGFLTTLAGNGIEGFSGDGGPATSAELAVYDDADCDGPGGGMAVDGAGDLVFADSYNDRVREVASSGIISTIAGNGSGGTAGGGGPATSANVNEPFSVAFDGAGNLFISALNIIRKVSPSGIISTVGGNGTYGYSGDGGSAANAALTGPGTLALDGAGNIYFADSYNNAIRVLRPTNHSVLIGAVVDAASESAVPITPGKIVVIYGAGLGPAGLIQNQPSNGLFGTTVGGTVVSFNGTAAPLIYTSATQVAAIVPYAVTGMTAQVTVSYQGETSAGFTVPVALSAPSIFTSNETGAGQAAALNADGTVNTAANPVKIGGYISLYATGEGQTSPSGVDGKLGSSSIHPLLPVSVTVGGIPATVQYEGARQEKSRA